MKEVNWAGNEAKIGQGGGKNKPARGKVASFHFIFAFIASGVKEKKP